MSRSVGLYLRLIEMGSPYSDVMPLVCPVTKQDLPYVERFCLIVRALYHSDTRDARVRDELTRQLFYARDIVRAILAERGCDRCEVGSCDCEFMWWPFAQSRTVWTVATLDRVIAAFLAVKRGDMAEAAAVARDVVRA